MPSLATRFDMVPYEVSITGLDDPGLRVLSFSGHERLSQSYEYTIDLVSTDDGLALEDLIGKALTLQINAVDGQPQRWLHGVISSFQQAESSKRVTAYRAHVVPALQLLSYRQDCRVFQNLSVPDIIKQVFDEAGLTDYELKLDASYPERVYCVQYRESDLNFVARLMEDEGIFFFFDHGEDKTTLTLGDQPSAHSKLPEGDTLEHHDTGGGLAEGDFVFGIRWQEAITVNAVVLRDFDFKKPSVEHMHLDKGVDQCIKLEQYDYPGAYEDPDVGYSRVCSRLDALQSSRQQVTAATTVRRLLPGFTFTLSEHPNARFNRDYVITAVSHSGSSPQALEQDQGGAAPSYNCQFSAAPAETVQRPLIIARRPRVESVQTAIVVGPAGEEIYTDEFARVKVQFHWDRLGKYDEKSSCWVRVSQLWAGAGWGGMDIPRIGHEVIVSFEEGDPDRPLITGRVYHGQNRPPHQLPADKVKSTIRSNSTPGGGGFNELTFDDTKDKEEVFLHSQRNTTIETGNDKNQTTGNDESLSIGNDRTKNVGANESTTIGSNRTEDVGSDENITIGANRTEQVGSNEQISIGSERAIDVGSNETVSIGDSQSVTIGKSRDVSVGKEDSLNVEGGRAVAVGKSFGTAVKKNYSLEAKKIAIEAGDEISIKTGKASILMKKNGDITLKGNKITVKGSGNVIIKGSKIKEN